MTRFPSRLPANATAPFSSFAAARSTGAAIERTARTAAAPPLTPTTTLRGERGTGRKEHSNALPVAGGPRRSCRKSDCRRSDAVAAPLRRAALVRALIRRAQRELEPDGGETLPALDSPPGRNLIDEQKPVAALCGPAVRLRSTPLEASAGIGDGDPERARR